MDILEARVVTRAVEADVSAIEVVTDVSKLLFELVRTLAFG